MAEKWFDEYIFPNDVGAHQLANSINSGTAEQTIKSVRDWIEANVTWQSDFTRYGEDYIQAPYITYSNGEGDCQDITSLVSSTLFLHGYPVSLVKGRVNDPEYGWLGHIWSEIRVPSKGVTYALDGSYDYFEKEKGQGITYDDRRVVTEVSPWIVRR